MQFFQSLHGVEPEQLTELARHAEQLGFAGVTFGDHLVKPAQYANEYLYSDDGRPPWDPEDLHDWTPPYVDPWVAAAALGQVTTTLRFLPYVYVLPMRHPVHVAKQLATADLFAPGRVILGVGAGWLREEFEIVDAPFENRGLRTDESLELIRRLLSGRDVRFDGRSFQLPPSRMRPVPRAPLPVMVGGDSDAALRRASRHDGWLGVDYDLDELPQILRRLHRYRDESGRAGEPFDVFAVCKQGVSRDAVNRLEDLGVTMTQEYAWFYKGEPYSDIGKKKDAMSRFADAFIR